MADAALRTTPWRQGRAGLRDDFQRARQAPLPLPVEPTPEADPAPRYRRVHPARAAAHAAYATVVGGGPRALDAALAVVEADLGRVRLKALQQEEALKLLRLYASDQWARSVAERALDTPPVALAACLPSFLHDPALAEGRPCTCGDHR